MKEPFSNFFKSFSSYYQETTFRRLIVGLIAGLFLWFSFLAITIAIDILTINTVFWDTFVIDLPGIGGITALLLTLQIWGLLPQPKNDNDEKISVEKLVDENFPLENTITEEILPDDTQE